MRAGACSSTSTSRSRGRGRSSGRRATSAPASATGSRLEAARYEAARDAALVDLRRHPELEHDDEIWFRFTERIVRGMGGDADSAYACAVEITRGWERHENFELYDDVPDALAALRAAGLRIGLVSNSARDVREFARHHGLDVDAGISSFHHGRTKPHASIFRAVLDLLEVEPAEAVMVGDTIADDIEGALALGMRAILARPRGHDAGLRAADRDAERAPAAARALSSSSRRARGRA